MPAAIAVHRALGPSDRRLAEFRKAARIAHDRLLKRGLDPSVDQSDSQRLLGLDPPPGEQKVLRPRRPDQFDEATRLGVTVDEAELRRRHGEIGVGRAEAQIAGQRQPEPAADRVSPQDRDRRAVEVDQRLETVLNGVAVIARGGGVAIDRVEFRDVGAGAEMPAGALDQRDQNILAGFDRRADRRQRAPHGARDRIAALRPVEDDACERRFELEGDVGHGGLVSRRGLRRLFEAFAGLEQTGFLS